MLILQRTFGLDTWGSPDEIHEKAFCLNKFRSTGRAEL